MTETSTTGLDATTIAKRTYTRYIAGLLRGEDQHTAAKGAKVMVAHIEAFILDANRDPTFHAMMRDALDGLDLSMLWDEKLHALALLRLINGPYTKDVARIAALDRIAALYKIDTITAPKAGGLPNWRDLLNAPRPKADDSEPVKDADEGTKQ